MCGRHFLVSVRFRFGFHKNRGFRFGSGFGKPTRGSVRFRFGFYSQCAMAAINLLYIIIKRLKYRFPAICMFVDSCISGFQSRYTRIRLLTK